MFIDIESAYNNNMFFAGTKLRDIPRGGYDLRRCTRSRLSNRTLFNLQQFNMRFGINWYDYQIYDVDDRMKSNTRSGFIIYGKINYQPDFISYITYGRVETTSGCAGSTKVWIMNGIPLQKSALLESIDVTFKKYEYPYNMWVELVAPFAKRKNETK